VALVTVIDENRPNLLLEELQLRGIDRFFDAARGRDDSGKESRNRQNPKLKHFHGLTRSIGCFAAGANPDSR
jgi:hypothetical protein